MFMKGGLRAVCESSVSPGGNQDFILSDGEKTFRQQAKEKAKDDTNKQCQLLSQNPDITSHL